MRSIYRSIIGIVLLFQASGCATSDIDSTAITFPHIVGTLSPLQLELASVGSVLQYQVVCQSAGPYRAVSVEFHTANSDGGAGQGVGLPVNPEDVVQLFQNCMIATVVTEGTLPPLNGIKVGDTIEVTFKVTPANGGEQTITRSYIKGEDRALHSSNP